MKKLDLRICGEGKDVTVDELGGIETPAPEGQWYPISHKDLVDQVVGTLVRSGMQVVNERHLIARNGLRYFGLLQIAGSDGGTMADYSEVVGLRNAHDKSIVAGLCMGSGVFVCSNLAFSGEVQIARKHTTNINRDLPGLIESAVGRLGDLRKRQDIRIDAYKSCTLLDSQVHDIIIQALDARIIPVTRIPHVLDQWRKPEHEEFAEKKNGWRLFNSFTESLKDSALFQRPQATQALHGIMDTACGVK